MTTFARVLHSLTGRCAARLRGRSLVPIIVAGACAAPLLAAAPASALVSEVETHPGEFTKVGLQSRTVSSLLDGGLGASFSNASGAPVLHGNDIYAIYWDPEADYLNEWQTLVNTFLQGVGAESGTRGNVFAVDGQYTDKTNQTAEYRSTLKVSYIDDAPYPTAGCTDPEPLEVGAVTCITDKQIQTQLQAFIAEHKLPTGMGPIFYVLTPPGVTVCLDGGGPTGHCSDFVGTDKQVEAEEAEHKEGEVVKTFKKSFCSYHSDINPGGTSSGDASTIVYGVIPWTAGGLGSASVFPDLQAYDCQDGGFNPASKPAEEREHAREKNEKEKEVEAEATPEEKAKDKRAEELEGPHEEEPNQLTGTGSDGAYDTGLADLIINQIAVEQQNIVTDPLLNAWRGSGGLEATDECRDWFAGGASGGSVTANEETGAGTLYNQALGEHAYYLNLAFNLSALRFRTGVPCIGGDNLLPRFTAPNPVNSGETVGFDGMESIVDLSYGIKYSAGAPGPNYATYTWNFGDGTPEVSGYAPGAPVCEAPWLSPCAGSAFHSYQYGGTYEVTLTIKDVAGNTESITHPVTVVGPPPPSSGEGGSGAGSGTSSGGPSTPGGSSPSATPTSVPAPVAAAAIVPQSLRRALRKGLIVRYSVNEQVAGRFEVLLSQATARRLGISGTPATGLPAGTPAELVIAKAVLVTTKGGRSTVHIRFSKRTAARLAHAHGVSLMLQLVVRNADSSNPTTTTVLSSATLSR